MLSYERTSMTAMMKMILFEELIYVLDLLVLLIFCLVTKSNIRFWSEFPFLPVGKEEIIDDLCL